MEGGATHGRWQCLSRSPLRRCPLLGRPAQDDSVSDARSTDVKRKTRTIATSSPPSAWFSTTHQTSGVNPVHIPPKARTASSKPRFSNALRIGEDRRTPENEKRSEGTESWRLRAQREGEFLRNWREGDLGESGVAAGVGADEEGLLRTHSNHAPASPLLKQAARIAAKPLVGSCERDTWRVGEGLGSDDSSWTMATPVVRRMREIHFWTERERRKKRMEKMAVVRSLSCVATSVSMTPPAKK